MKKEDQLFDRLLIAYISHEITDKNKEKLFSMIMESEQYKAKYESALKLSTLALTPYFKSHQNQDYLILKKKAVISTNSSLKRFNIHRFTLLGRIAILIILIASGSLGTIYFYEKQDKGKTLQWFEASTPLGGQTKLHLPDGSIAWINAKSELKYTSGFGKTDRNLFLSGEGYFEVKRNEQLRFSVHTDEMTVIATGTKFNVKTYADNDQSEVQLIEGGVDILISGNHFSLKPDQKIIYDKMSALHTIEQAEAYMAIQWTKGKLSFQQASILEIYKMLERHFNVRIENNDKELKEEYFMGNINLNMSLSEILSYLDVEKKYKIEFHGDTVLIQKNNAE